MITGYHRGDHPATRPELRVSRASCIAASRLSSPILALSMRIFFQFIARINRILDLPPFPSPYRYFRSDALFTRAAAVCSINYQPLFRSPCDCASRAVENRIVGSSRSSPADFDTDFGNMTAFR